MASTGSSLAALADGMIPEINPITVDDPTPIKMFS